MDRTRAARSALWSLAESGGLSLISLGSLVIYTRLLSSEQFGLFSILLGLIELLQVTVTMLFHDALVQREAVTEAHFDSAFSFGVVLSVLLFALCCVGSPLLAVLVDDRQAAWGLSSMALCLPAASLSATIVARQRRSLAFRPLAVRSLLGRLVGALGGIALVALGAGLWGLIAQQVLIVLVGSLVLWKTCADRPRFRFRRRELEELWAFALPALGALLLNFGIKRLFTVLAGISLGVTAAGYLNLSFRAIDVFWSIAATAVTQVALPMLASVRSDLPKLGRAFQQATGFVCLVMYACFIGIAVTAPEVVSVMFGDKWLPSAPYVAALACLVLVQAPRLLMGPLLTALGRPGELLLLKGLELVCMLALIFASGVPHLAFAIGIWIATSCVSFPLSVVMVKRAAKLGVAGQLRGIASPLAASLVMVLAVSLTRSSLPPGLSVTTRLLALVPVGALSFGCSAVLLDRELVTFVVGFVRSALARRPAAEQPSET